MVNYTDLVLYALQLPRPQEREKLPKFQWLESFATMQLDFGRCTGKSRAALELLGLITGSALMVSNNQVSDELRKRTGLIAFTKHDLQKTQSYYNKPDSTVLLCDDVRCGSRLLLQDFALARGFSQIVILGST